MTQPISFPRFPLLASLPSSHGPGGGMGSTWASGPGLSLSQGRSTGLGRGNTHYMPFTPQLPTSIHSSASQPTCRRLWVGTRWHERRAAGRAGEKGDWGQEDTKVHEKPMCYTQGQLLRLLPTDWCETGLVLPELPNFQGESARTNFV